MKLLDKGDGVVSVIEGWGEDEHEAHVDARRRMNEVLWGRDPECFRCLKPESVCCCHGQGR